MTLRQLPGTVLLGLLAALLAHTADYGGSHEAGGLYHTAFVLVALAGAGSFALLATVLGALAGRQGDGSLLAARLRPMIPRTPALLLGATGWFATMEALEPRHTAAALAVVAISLLLASVVLRIFTRWLVRAIAQVAFIVFAAPHHARVFFAERCFALRPSVRTASFVYRRFARPPPV
jgi:hypothetical protein